MERYEEVEFSLHNGQQFPLSYYAQYLDGRAEVDPEPLYLFEDLSLVPHASAETASTTGKNNRVVVRLVALSLVSNYPSLRHGAIRIHPGLLTPIA
jgi:hypothetical protein